MKVPRDVFADEPNSNLQVSHREVWERRSNSEAVARRTGRHAGWLHGGQYEAYQADKLAKGSEVQKANVTLMRKLNG